MRDEQLHPVVARSTFPSQNVESTPSPDHFWKLRCRKMHTVAARSTCRSQNVENTPAPGCDVEKVHAVVARSTCRSQKIENTPGSDHFWKLRYRESGRRCGAKHTSKSKCRKHTSFGPLLEVEMWKKWTPLWREAHFEVKSAKN